MGPLVHSAQKQWTPNGRPTPGSPGKTIPEAPDRRSDDRSKGLLATDLLPTYGKRNQCVVFALRPSLHFGALCGPATTSRTVFAPTRPKLL